MDSSKLIIAALSGYSDFSVGTHLTYVKSMGVDQKRRKEIIYDGLLKEIVSDLNPFRKRQILRSRLSGFWLTLTPLSINGTVLSRL